MFNHIKNNMPKLILASQSQSRKYLLDRLRIPYQAIPANIDESALPEELPQKLVLRLAKQKAEKIANKVSEYITKNKESSPQ